MMSRKTKAIIAICAMSFITLASSATSPALSTIADNFPEASEEAIASIATLSSLTAVPFTILSGLLLGKRVKFRTLASVGLLAVLAGGILPFFFTNVAQILVGRAILGAGTGLCGPIVSTLTLSLFQGEEIAKQFGRNTMTTNVGAVIFQLLGGFLCNYNWRMPFAAYLTVIPVLLIVYFLLPEPEKVKDEKRVLSKRFDLTSLKKIVTPHVLLWGVLHGMYMVFFYPYVTEISKIICSNGMGDALTAAIIMSVFTAMGVLGGYLFYYLNKKCGRYVFSVGFFICATAYMVLIFANSAGVAGVASGIFGIGYGILGPAISYYLGIGLEPEYRAASVAAASLLNHLGSFGSPFVMKWLREIFDISWERFSFLAGACFFVIVALLFLCVGWISLAQLKRVRKKVTIG